MPPRLPLLTPQPYKSLQPITPHLLIRPPNLTMSSPITTSPNPEFSLAASQDEEFVTQRANILTTTGSQGAPRNWEVVLEGRGLSREFRFRGFNRCWVRFFSLFYLGVPGDVEGLGLYERDGWGFGGLGVSGFVVVDDAMGFGMGGDGKWVVWRFHALKSKFWEDQCPIFKLLESGLQHFWRHLYLFSLSTLPVAVDMINGESSKDRTDVERDVGIYGRGSRGM